MITKKYILNNMRRTNNPSWVSMDCFDSSCPNPKNHLYYNLVTGHYHCFRCQVSGTFKLDEKVAPVKEDKIIFKGQLPDGCFPIKNGRGHIEKKVIKYLYSRGFVDDDFQNYNIHYGAFGNLANRAIFPFIRKKKISYYCARDITNESEKRYLNPRGIKDVFNIEVASKYSEVVVVEGVIDAIMTGYDAISFLGKSVNPTQIETLKKYGVKDVNIMIDSISKDQIKNNLLSVKDQLKDSFKLARRLAAEMRTVKVIVLTLGDPGSIRLRERSTFGAWKGLFKEVKYSLSNVLRNIEINRRMFDDESEEDI